MTNHLSEPVPAPSEILSDIATKGTQVFVNTFEKSKFNEEPLAQGKTLGSVSLRIISLNGSSDPFFDVETLVIRPDFDYQSEEFITPEMDITGFLSLVDGVSDVSYSARARSSGEYMHEYVQSYKLDEPTTDRTTAMWHFVGKALATAKSGELSKMPTVQDSKFGEPGLLRGRKSRNARFYHQFEVAHDSGSELTGQEPREWLVSYGDKLLADYQGAIQYRDLLASDAPASTPPFADFSSMRNVNEKQITAFSSQLERVSEALRKNSGNA